jgi:hypothetical protein
MSMLMMSTLASVQRYVNAAKLVGVADIMSYDCRASLCIAMDGSQPQAETCALSQSIMRACCIAAGLLTNQCTTKCSKQNNHVYFKITQGSAASNKGIAA